MASPTQRTLEWLRKSRYVAGVVEKRNPKMRFVTHDYLGIIDIVAVGPGETIGVQATSAAHVASRAKKIVGAEHTKAWLTCDFRRLLVVGWSKKGAHGKAKHWTPTVREINLDPYKDLFVIEIDYRAALLDGFKP